MLCIKDLTLKFHFPFNLKEIGLVHNSPHFTLFLFLFPRLTLHAYLPVKILRTAQGLNKEPDVLIQNPYSTLGHLL